MRFPKRSSPPRGKALEKKAYEIFLIFDFFLTFYIIDFFLDFFNKVYVISFSALPLDHLNRYFIIFASSDAFEEII